jgi:Membrane bound O-acyl transferase family
MNAPLLAQSVSEFWRRRWNTAFRDLTYRFLFRPLNARFGPRTALIAGFVFSGLVHELAISIPAGGGYGGPTLFFVLQVPTIFLERSRLGHAIGLGQGWRGWLLAALVLIVPAGLLFHPPFIRNLVLPFLDAIGVG